MASFSRMSYYSALSADEDSDIEDVSGEDDGAFDGRTPLDRTIDRIGMGELVASAVVLWASHGTSGRVVPVDAVVVVRFR